MWPPHRLPEDVEMLSLWKAGKNTNEIAKAFWCPESEIANRLPALLNKARQDQEWNFDRTA